MVQVMFVYDMAQLFLGHDILGSQQSLACVATLAQTLINLGQSLYYTL